MKVGKAVRVGEREGVVQQMEGFGDLGQGRLRVLNREQLFKAIDQSAPTGGPEGALLIVRPPEPLMTPPRARQLHAGVLYSTSTWSTEHRRGGETTVAE